MLLNILCALTLWQCNILPQDTTVTTVPAHKTAAVQRKSVVARLNDSVINKNERKTFNTRKPTAYAIESLLVKDGITNDAAIIAVLANAWAESRWNERERTSIYLGIFQVSSRGGGRFTRESLQTIHGNYHAIKQQSGFSKWETQAKSSNDAGKLAFLFAKNVERCAEQHRKPRLVLANKWLKALKK